MESQNKPRGALVWIISGSFLLTYSSIGLFGWQVPGVEEIISFIGTAEGTWFYLVAFLSAFIEGLYLIGHIIPGSTIMMLIAILSASLGYTVFFVTFLFLWLGWVLAGLINIIIATKVLTPCDAPTITASDNILITWYPAFRANHEVAEIALGAKRREVILSSIRVKTIVCLLMAVFSFLIHITLDVTQINNREGFTLVVVFSLISIGIGISKWPKRTSSIKNN